MPIYDARISYPACLSNGGRSGAQRPERIGISEVVFTTDVTFSGGGQAERATESARAVAREGTAGGVRFVRRSSTERWLDKGEEGVPPAPGVLAAESRPRRQGKEENVVFARARCLGVGSGSWGGMDWMLVVNGRLGRRGERDGQSQA